MYTYVYVYIHISIKIYIHRRTHISRQNFMAISSWLKTIPHFHTGLLQADALCLINFTNHIYKYHELRKKQTWRFFRG